MLKIKKSPNSVSLRMVDTILALLFLLLMYSLVIAGKRFYFSDYDLTLIVTLVLGVCPIFIAAFFKPPAFFQLATAMSVGLLLVVMFISLSLSSGGDKPGLMVFIVYHVFMPWWYVGWYQALKYARMQKNNSKIMPIKAVVLPVISFFVPLFCGLTIISGKPFRDWFFSDKNSKWNNVMVWLLWVGMFLFYSVMNGFV